MTIGSLSANAPGRNSPPRSAEPGEGGPCSNAPGGDDLVLDRLDVGPHAEGVVDLIEIEETVEAGVGPVTPRASPTLHPAKSFGSFFVLGDHAGLDSFQRLGQPG